MENETYLTFVLDQDHFAVNVINVIEVLEQQHITKLPKAPKHILGIINFRGEILPVISTHRKFNYQCENESTNTYVIVYDIIKDDTHLLIAATADRVKDVIEVNNSELKPVPEMGIQYDARFISGAIMRDNRFTIIINPEKLFSASDTEIPIPHQQIEN